MLNDVLKYSMVKQIKEGRFLSGTSIEIINEVLLPSPPKFVVFDFDGTLSLIREGWPDIMIPMFVDVLRSTGTSETEEVLYHVVSDFVMALNGRQTIYQMIRLVEEVLKRNGQAESPDQYKRMYHKQLMNKICTRRENLKTGIVSHRDMLVPGSIEILEALRDIGVILYLVSGTDEKYVFEEARLLKIDKYFRGNIYGALDNYRLFSKALLIRRILQTKNISPEELLVFGDGYVEIQNMDEIGGTAVAVDSDERWRSGKPDESKRARLINIGADIVIPDFSEAEHLLKYIWKDR